MFKIRNPYQAVNWDTWGAYKANLHTHTTFSDGEVPLDEMVEEHYRQGFDIVALTDHGVINHGWAQKHKTVPVVNIITLGRKKRILTSERSRELHAGKGRGGRGMLDLQTGIECNTAVLNKNHICSYFAGYGQGVWGRENDFETALRKTENRGGVTVINHPGDWLHSSGDPQLAQEIGTVRFFGNLLVRYPSCLGIEVFNSRDRRTRHDRVLWDALLEYTLPLGRTVFGFANSDAHFFSVVDSMCNYFLLPPNYAPTAPDAQQLVRAAMQQGTFFAMGRRAHGELGDDFVGEGAYPMVTRITVDEKAQTITIGANEHTEKIAWIAKGEIIAHGNTLRLSAHAEKIGCYVRAQLTGPGGVCLTQPFVTDTGRWQPPVDTRTNAQKRKEHIRRRLLQLRPVAIPAHFVAKLRRKKRK